MTGVAVLPLDELGFRVEYFDPLRLDTLDDDGSPVFLPASSEAQAAAVRALREQFGCWISPVVAVVNDYDGHQTYTAIKYGATCVLNLAVPPEAQLALLESVMAPGPVTEERADGAELRPVPAPTSVVDAGPAGAGPADAGPATGARPATEADTLIRLLCGDETVSAIARRFFCSERTMYRRIRALYDALQVSGRSELRSLMAVQDWAS